MKDIDIIIEHINYKFKEYGFQIEVSDYIPIVGVDFVFNDEYNNPSLLKELLGCSSYFLQKYQTIDGKHVYSYNISREGVLNEIRVRGLNNLII